MITEPSDEIREARRTLASISGYEPLEDLTWDTIIEQWVLKFRITRDKNCKSDFIPAQTDWFITISPAYPFGNIDIFPALENGITATFPHQSYNIEKPGSKWRTGNICVNTSLGIWGKKFFNTEPYTTAERLAWHIERCKEWIHAACTGALAVKGDPFELPPLNIGSSQLLSFNEDQDTFRQWKESGVTSGVCWANEFNSPKAIFTVSRFKLGNKEIKYNWGTSIQEASGQEFTNLWVMLSDVPVLAPWQIPRTWKELFDIARVQGVDLFNILEQSLFKGGKLLRKFLLIGFPIPKNIGEEAIGIHWLSLVLPSSPKIAGFRVGSPAMVSAQLKIMFRDDAAINWMITENWNKIEITSRGKMTTSITDLRFLVIGAGAIGSHVSELLVRLGVDQITIIDNDILQIGNLSRHSLTLDSLGEEKATSLAKRLNSIFPSVNAIAIKKNMDHKLSRSRLGELLNQIEVFIDATGDDSVIHFMSALLNGQDKKFISLSTGFAANRLFGFMKNTKDGCLATSFTQVLSPWLKKDADENPDPEFPREGIGCWHPIFPARVDDIWLLLSTAFRHIESFIDDGRSDLLIVVEKIVNEKGIVTGSNITEELH